MEIVKQAMDELMLTDVWRDRNPGVFRATFQRRKPYSASRIDNAIVSTGLSSQINSVFYIPGLMTDHSAMFLSIEVCESLRGTGYWKINDSHILNQEYVESMNQKLQASLFENSHLPPQQKWELLKFEAKTFAQNYAIEKAGNKKLIINQLYEKIMELEESLSENFDEKLDDLLIKSKQDLNEMESEKAKSVMFRSKAKWQIEGERNTAYYYNLEKARHGSRTCKVLIDDSNRKVTNPRKILKMQHKFYSELYTAQKNVKFTAKNNTANKLSYNEMLEMDQQVTKKEIKAALKEMVQHKTPGIDGLSVTFYKMFFNIIGDALFEALIAGLESGMLQKTARTGVINLIPKAKKDIRKLANLRPITLLGVDYKILEKALANRIKIHIEKLISMEQRGFMKNRRIAANIRRIFDLIQHSEENNLDNVIISVDFLKCFDRIEFEGIFGSLKFFGFGMNYINMIRTTYNEFTAVVQNNGHFSEPISINRGVHQGGPNSSFLFLLGAEVLAMDIRKAEIEGIPVNDIVHLLNQYADDMDVSTKGKKENLDKLFRIFDKYEQQIGLKVNYQKTSVYRIGSLKNSNAKFYTDRELNWTNEPINVLGIWIDHSETVTMRLNYEPLLDKAHAIFKQWEKRNVSLLGKIMLINTLVASLFIYKMTVLPNMPRAMVKTLENMFTAFLWGGGKSKISLKILQSGFQSGGTKLVNLLIKEKALKISWLGILEKDPLIANLAYNVIHRDLVVFIGL